MRLDQLPNFHRILPSLPWTSRVPVRPFYNFFNNNQLQEQPSCLGYPRIPRHAHTDPARRSWAPVSPRSRFNGLSPPWSSLATVIVDAAVQGGVHASTLAHTNATSGVFVTRDWCLFRI